MRPPSFLALPGASCNSASSGYRHVPDRALGKAIRGGFTLLQILLVLGLISLLSAVLVGQFGRSREAVRRAQCDVHLKGLVYAVDTYRQETGRLPKTLMELNTKGYVPDLDTFRCAADPDLATKGRDATYASYEDGYVLRDALDSGELPLIVCAFHEKEGEHGAQGFKGGYTNSFSTRGAILSGISGAVTVTRPGKGVLEIPDTGRLAVMGGDRIKVGAGTALLTFSDGSSAEFQSNSEMSVLESYLAGQTSNSIYTLVRQFAGTISYTVTQGNRFDVATPTATAGALGTRFTITIVEPLVVIDKEVVNGNGANGKPQPKEALLLVTEHTVAFTCQGRTINVSAGRPGVRSDAPDNILKPHNPRTGRGSFGGQNSATSGGNTAPGGGTTPNSTPQPTPNPTPKPPSSDEDEGDDKGDKDNDPSDGNNGGGNDGRGGGKGSGKKDD